MSSNNSNKSLNINNSSKNNIVTSNNMSMAIKVISILSIIYIIYRVYLFYSTREVRTKDIKELVTKSKNGKKSSLVKSKNIPTSDFSNEYAISFWIYLDDYNYKFKKRKNILLKGKSDGSNANPEIYLEPIENNLTVKIKLQSESFSKERFESVTLPNVNEEPSSEELNEVLNKINNNLTPSSSIEYNEDFFAMISGNTIETKEDFSDADSSTNQLNNQMNIIVQEIKEEELTVNKLKIHIMQLLTTLCELFSRLESDENIKASLKDYDIFFDLLIGMLDIVKEGLLSEREVSEQRYQQLFHQYGFSTPEAKQINIFGENSNLLKSYLYILRFQTEASDSIKNVFNQEKQTITKNMMEKMEELNCSLNINLESSELSLEEQVINVFRNKGKKIIVKMAQEIDPDLIYLNPDLDKFDLCTIKNVKLQRWTHIVVSVYNNIVDIYYDGKLRKSCVLKGFPEPNTNDLHLNRDGGFSGKLAKTSFINAALSQNEVQNLYNMGPVYREGLFGTVANYFNQLF